MGLGVSSERILCVYVDGHVIHIHVHAYVKPLCFDGQFSTGGLSE